MNVHLHGFCSCCRLCWLLVVGCWLLVVGCWLLVVGCLSTQPGGSEARLLTYAYRQTQYQRSQAFWPSMGL